MPFEFKLPDIGEGVAEGEIVQWFVKEGDRIAEDAPLVSVLTDKANVEIPSPRTGRIAKLHAAVGAKVKVGGLLVTIDTGDAPSPSDAPKPPAAASTPGRDSAAPSSTPAAAPAVAAPPTSSGRVLAPPRIRRLAAERGIDLATVRGSGPQGQITEADLSAPSAPSAPAPRAPPAPVPPASKPAGSPSAAPVGEGAVQREPIRGLRRAIADHMAESKHRAAHFTYVEEIDVSELVRFRDRMAKHVEASGAKLTYLPFIIKAVIAGLRAHPRLNARMDDEHQELVIHSGYHIGVAAATPGGLIVPVIHHADRQSVAELARTLQDLSVRGKAGTLSRAELSGSTFTISSLGALGGVLATPILNYPEVGILGVHRIVRRPVYRADGSIGPADLMNLSISLDHRVIDGIEGAQFLAVVKGFLEDPHRLFAELA
ncbi:MAG: dihydrolipoamide acetyltransferase family protein [Thermoplasmata archaeon]